MGVKFVAIFLVALLLSIPANIANPAWGERRLEERVAREHRNQIVAL
jgi:hypothetical protein